MPPPFSFNVCKYFEAYKHGIFFKIVSCGYSTNRSKSSKVYDNIAETVADIPDGAKLLVGGFGLCGIPEKLIAAVLAKGSSKLTVVSNNAGMLMVK